MRMTQLRFGVPARQHQSGRAVRKTKETNIDGIMLRGVRKSSKMDACVMRDRGRREQRGAYGTDRGFDFIMESADKLHFSHGLFEDCNAHDDDDADRAAPRLGHKF